MEDRYRGVTASLTLVTMAALLVAFGSSSRRRSTEGELLLLEEQVHQLAQTNKTLEEKVRWVEGRYSQSVTLGKRLNEALIEEQAKTKALSERLQQSKLQPSQESAAGQ